jgi:hypothetical protein
MEYSQSCDNKSRAHDPITIGEDNNAQRVLCKECKSVIVIRKDWRGAPEKRQYAEVFKRDILQRSENLFYKYYPQYLQA